MIVFPQIPMDVHMERLWKEGLRVAQNFSAQKTSTQIHELLASYCKYKEIERVLALGVRVSDQNNEGDTAVHVAYVNCASGHILDLLLISYLRETRMNLKNKDGLSVLHIACSRFDLEIVKRLVEWNPDDVNCQSNVLSSSETAGSTPLHIAVEYDRYDISKYLLETCKVDFCKQNKFGSTPLHIALDRRSVQTIDLILAHDRNYVDVVDDSGLTHFMAACSGSSTRIVACYLKHNNVYSLKNALINTQVYEDIPEYDFAGYTPLHFAAEFGRYDIVQILLLYCGTSCFTKNVKNQTPLVLAIHCGYARITLLLLRFYKMFSKALFALKNIDSM